jgi:tetratricopeptide (TPR) repeat protein
MNELLEYIDNYFNGLLSPGEKGVFETRCETDEQFAAEVALYITSRNALRNEILELKRKEWKNIGNTSGVIAKKKSAKPVKMRRMYLLLAAAASVIAIVFLLLPYKKSPQQLADSYIKKNLQRLGVAMQGTKDSLQDGISAYNKKEYEKAQVIFEQLYRNDPDNTDALKYEGLTKLMQLDYDGAAGLFDELAAKQNLFANPGLFYKALVLLKRNAVGDTDKARQLLQQVIDRRLEGDKESAELLKRI